MRFGVILPNYGKPAAREALVEVARAAEELGYDSIWTTDHILLPRGHEEPFGHIYETLITLAYLAGVTEKVRIGTSVLVLPLRNPIIVAKEAATLDLLSGGRLILGLGVGWLEQEFAFLGSEFKKRGSLCDEGIELMRALWSQDRPSFSGRHYKFFDSFFSPKPAQPGGPPIWIGGVSEAAMRRAARLGDSWHPTGLTVERFAQGMARVRELAGERRVSGSIRLRIAIGKKRSGRLPGLAGEPEAIIAGLRSYRDAGLDYLVANFGEDDAKTILAEMRRFKEEIAPALNSAN